MAQETNDETKEQPTPSNGFTRRHPFIVYTALRLLLLIAVGGVFYLIGARGIILILLAFLVSGLISLIMLNRQRDEVGDRVGGYFRRLNERIEESKRSEDDIIDAHLAAQQNEAAAHIDDSPDLSEQPDSVSAQSASQNPDR